LDESTPSPAPQDVEDLEDLFENAPCGYISLEPAGRIIKANQTFTTWTGYGQNQIVGRRFHDLLSIAGKIYYETHFAPLLRMQGFFSEVALDLVCADGSRLTVLVNAVERRDDAGRVRFIRVTIFNASDRRRYEHELLEARRVADQASAELRELNRTLGARIEEAVQERMKAEEALRQAQKMEAVGQLTSGIAHDFNNLLAGITGSLEMLRIRAAQGRTGDLERYITAAEGASKRAATLTHRLLAFSRRQALDPGPANINRLIVGMEDLIRRTVGPSVRVEVVAAGGLWATLIDTNQLENALLNLCINARDAMPSGGTLTIETANRWLDKRAARGHGVPPGQYISLSVSDTGTGMTPEVIEHAFDPFFTTKPSGQGTGLGLSMIYGFIRQSGGQVRIYSELDQGTTMCLYLPRHLGEAEDVEDVEVPKRVEAPYAGQGETVLVVDDEPTVRMLVAEVLEEMGYTAIEAAASPAGLRVLQSDARIDLLVTDVGLPGGMNGRQLAEAGRAVRPGLKVLFITGYAENAVISHCHLEPGMHMLTKPFTLDALASRIKGLITGIDTI
jgi:PAS domain S-box-containing protein